MYARRRINDDDVRFLVEFIRTRRSPWARRRRGTRTAPARQLQAYIFTCTDARPADLTYSQLARRARAQAMSPPAATGRGARDGDANSGLGEPLLENGSGGAHAWATVTVANGRRDLAAEKRRSAEDRYWVDIDQPEALEPADVESGRAGRRPLLFRNKRVKRSILYPYRCVPCCTYIPVSQNK